MSDVKAKCIIEPQLEPMETYIDFIRSYRLPGAKIYLEYKINVERYHKT